MDVLELWEYVVFHSLLAIICLILTGEPSYDPQHPDYVPSLYLDGKENDTTTGQQKLERYDRAQRHGILVDVSTPCSSKASRKRAADEGIQQMKKENELTAQVVSLTSQVGSLTAEVESLTNDVETLKSDKSVLQKEIQLLKDHPMSVGFIRGDDKRTKFYTGLTTFILFQTVFDFVVPLVQTLQKMPGKLSLMDEFLMVLMKLRLGLLNEDLGYRFGVSNSTVSRIFHKWLESMYCRLKPCIRWPDKETVRKTLPIAFQKHYLKVRCIIDCTEVFIERPTSLRARAQTYSNYKKHNTIKFLIGITPSGVICFLSKCWGGRVSDKELTQESGFLSKLEPTDEIMADRGFLIEEELALQGAKLTIPAFTKGKKQLSQKDVELSRQIANVRIHVERVIGLLKNRYTILQSRLPITLIKRKGDTEVATVDKLVTVCSALTNLGEPVV